MTNGVPNHLASVVMLFAALTTSSHRLGTLVFANQEL